MTEEQDANDISAMLRDSARDFAAGEKDLAGFRRGMNTLPGYDAGQHARQPHSREAGVAEQPRLQQRRQKDGEDALGTGHGCHARHVVELRRGRWAPRARRRRRRPQAGG